MGKNSMKCPCCKNELMKIYTHTKLKDCTTDERTYVIYTCVDGSQWCNGMLVKHDILDKKITFTTPAHTTVTLHVDYVTLISNEDLLRTIFSTFEYLRHLTTVSIDTRDTLLQLD